MSNRSKRTVVVFVAILAAAVVGIYFLKSTSNARKLADVKPPGPVYVEFAPVEERQWGTLVESVGTVQSFSGITLRAQIGGRVTAVHVRSGSSVKAGDPLFEINPKVIEAQLEENQAALKITKFNYERMKELYAERNVSLQDLTQAKSAYDVDVAKVATSQQQLALATTYATFDGEVGVTRVEVGDEVDVNQELATLQSSERLRVEFAVPQKYAPLIALGDSATLTAEQGPAQSVEAKVFAINPLVDQNTRTVTVRAEVPAHRFLPGSYVNVQLALDDAKAVLTVPQTALIHSLYGDSVFKVVDGKAVQTHVVPGTQRGADIEVSGKLQAGDQVVSAGLRKVTDGAAVKGVKDGAAAKGAAAGSSHAD